MALMALRPLAKTVQCFAFSRLASVDWRLRKFGLPERV
jgi:hypothetical protein